MAVAVFFMALAVFFWILTIYLVKQARNAKTPEQIGQDAAAAMAAAMEAMEANEAETNEAEADEASEPPRPADWHPDPKGEARLRYWDGTRWTDHTAA